MYKPTVWAFLDVYAAHALALRQCDTPSLGILAHIMLLYSQRSSVVCIFTGRQKGIRPQVILFLQWKQSNWGMRPTKVESGAFHLESKSQNMHELRSSKGIVQASLTEESSSFQSMS